MRSFPTREELLVKYPPGTIVELTAPLRDPYEKRLTTGSKAEIKGADDFGNLLCRWDNGSTLNIVPGDEFRVVGNFTAEIKANLLEIRSGGVSNMFDINTVQRIAFEKEWYETVDFLENCRDIYAWWVLKGE